MLQFIGFQPVMGVFLGGFLPIFGVFWGQLPGGRIDYYPMDINILG